MVVPRTGGFGMKKWQALILSVCSSCHWPRSFPPFASLVQGDAIKNMPVPAGFEFITHRLATRHDHSSHNTRGLSVGLGARRSDQGRCRSGDTGLGAGTVVGVRIGAVRRVIGLVDREYCRFRACLTAASFPPHHAAGRDTDLKRARERGGSTVEGWYY